ncbi:DMT family transporter [Eikenella sp. S3360]|uniref:DMT family transporter n=1 Tax=Eikenella glucosivorans TaxID=2766967 RepID=A0ABS0N711_9NEIS|nr:DMT family transporter [Eikenella glucosivorans]MBH5328060.1 DMT family transporter [Eikenella glucosivorans]
MLYQIIAVLLWSSAFIAAKYTYTMMDPLMMLLFRLGIAALLVLPACLRHWRGIGRQYWPGLLWLSFWNYVVVLALQFWGLKFTSAASTSTIAGLEPLLTVFIGHFFFRDRAAWYHWLCGLLAFVGVALLIAGGGEGGDISLLGCLMVLGGGVVFCATLRPTQKMIAAIGAPAFTSASMAVAPLLCLPVSLLLSDSLRIGWNMPGTLGLLYLGVCCSWLSYTFWNKGMTSVSANFSGMLTASEPIFGTLLAVLILGERISALSLLGVVLVISATVGSVMLPKLLAHRQEAT